MPSIDEFAGWVEVAKSKSYYEILRVNRRASSADVKAAFHAFALVCHPDQFAGEDPEIARAAGEAFKRGVEAYRVLSDAALRKRYDRALSRGKLRIDDKALSDPPPPPKLKTLEDVAQTQRGAAHARKADRLLSTGKLGAAHAELISAVELEPTNQELRERLGMVEQALALEGL
jgi:curved DNA-binding protein CbpA